MLRHKGLSRTKNLTEDEKKIEEDGTAYPLGLVPWLDSDLVYWFIRKQYNLPATLSFTQMHRIKCLHFILKISNA